jgi:signal peptidase
VVAPFIYRDELLADVELFRDIDLVAELVSLRTSVRAHQPAAGATVAPSPLPVAGGLARWTLSEGAHRVLSATSYGAGAVVLGLSLWATVPRALGWEPTLIDGGSMTPALRRGDVILLRDAGADSIAVGSVITFSDPADPDRLVTHRVVGIEPDGRLVTRGDANAVSDSTLVALDAVRGRAVLRIPAVGLPIVWVRNGDWQELVMLGGVVLAAYAVTTRRRPGDAISTFRSAVGRTLGSGPLGSGPLGSGRATPVHTARA